MCVSETNLASEQVHNLLVPPSRANLDVLAKQVSVETQPVAGDIESSLQQDIP